MNESKRKPVGTQQPESESAQERRRIGRVVHDDRGTATLEWYDAPKDYEHPLLELADEKPPKGAPGRGLDTGSLSINTDDSFNPYTRVPEGERKRGPGGRTDLRKLSAWIKMMRELEEARKHKQQDDEDEDP